MRRDHLASSPRKLDDRTQSAFAPGEGVPCLQAYAEGLASVIQLVPDFHWDLSHLLIDGCWLSAHLTDTGTTAGHRPVRLQEFAVC